MEPSCFRVDSVPLGLRNRAAGLRKDDAAVKNGLLYPQISNVPQEGANSRIEMKHRHEGGHAAFGLLNADNVPTVPRDVEHLLGSP